MNVNAILDIKKDKEFLEEAKKYLECSPNMKKERTVIKLNPEGKTYRKKLYLSLAHGNS